MTLGRQKRAILLCALLTVAGCGGGGNSTDNGTPPSTPAPTPTPTPTPAPTPTPPPTPAPAPAYSSASDFSRDRSFTAIGLRLGVDWTGPTAITQSLTDPEGPSIGFDFAAATRTYRARYNGESTIATVQGTAIDPSVDRASAPNEVITRSTLDYFIGGPTVPPTTTYVGLFTWRTDSNGLGVTAPGSRTAIRFLLFGDRTTASDLPTSGTTTFVGTSHVDGGPGGGASHAATIVVDYGARTVTGSTAFQPVSTRPARDPEPITFSGTLDPTTSRISGTATHVASGTSGRFEGSLYGPRGAEAALLISIQGSPPNLYYGALVGRR